MAAQHFSNISVLRGNNFILCKKMPRWGNGAKHAKQQDGRKASENVKGQVLFVTVDNLPSLNDKKMTQALNIKPVLLSLNIASGHPQEWNCQSPPQTLPR